jgi:hypothetical protein
LFDTSKSENVGICKWHLQIWYCNFTDGEVFENGVLQMVYLSKPLLCEWRHVKKCVRKTKNKICIQTKKEYVCKTKTSIIQNLKKYVL